MEEVERNRGLLEDQEAAFRAKREAVKRLEYDVNVIEKEGRKLHKEYEKVMRIEIPEEKGAMRDEQEIYTELKVRTAELYKHDRFSQDRLRGGLRVHATYNIPLYLSNLPIGAAATASRTGPRGWCR